MVKSAHDLRFLRSRSRLRASLKKRCVSTTAPARELIVIVGVVIISLLACNEFGKVLYICRVLYQVEYHVHCLRSLGRESWE